MTIAYEAEYDNRARVPEHQQIFEGWARDAAAYRSHAEAEECASLGLSYGPSDRQIIDLFFPDTTGRTPLALFLHGGYWRSFHPSSFSHMARGLNAHGIAVGIAGYDLCPQVTMGDIVTQIRSACLFLWRRFEQPLTIYGHSAGGHLSACMLATSWKGQEKSAPADLVTSAMSISGLFDLAPLVHLAMNADLRLDAAEAHRLSPLFWPLPANRRLDLLVGAQESSEFIRQSKTAADVFARHGVATRYEEIAGANHFTAVAPLADPDSATVKRLAALCRA